MRTKLIGAIFLPVILFATIARAHAQQAPYPQMAPLEQYLMDQSAEIALARSAAPASISDHAEILIMDQHGYKTAVKGTNGFVCIVERSWTNKPSNPGFWNPKVRAPFCLNPAAARSYLPITVLKTRLILAGESKEQMNTDLQAALDQKKIPSIERGAMCYMMSKQGYLNDDAHSWHPHVMIFTPLANDETWGANLPGSPVFAVDDHMDRFTIFMIPVAHWSDGTPDASN